MEKHTLFTLKPWREDGQGPFYCPACGEMEGFLAYSPEIREKIDIIEVDFQRPRAVVIEALGAENQECPVLMLAKDTPDSALPEAAGKSLSTGRVFINDAPAICEFLAQTFGGIRPHP